MANLQEKIKEKWDVVIGLEIHAQVSSKSKLFSRSDTTFGRNANTQVSLIDAAIPGTLPTVNKYCIEQAIRTGFAINATINKISIFDRKHYFYPDLPHGYQITQYNLPIVQEGYLYITNSLGNEKKIRINRIHLESDAGKSIHDKHDLFTLVDLNRAGIALMEIVTYPDLSSAQEAVQFIKKIRSIMQHIGSCDGDLEKGCLRCDANISIKPYGSTELGNRCEIKNLNSLNNIERAIESEILRQIDIKESGHTISEETRLFDDNTNQTKLMRSKEDVNDYSYFPEPDLLPVSVTDELILQIKDQLPELPDQKITRYVTEFNLTNYTATILVDDPRVSYYFDTIINFAQADIRQAIANLASNWLITELFGKIKRYNINIADCKILEKDFFQLMLMLHHNKISGKIAKTVFGHMFDSGEEPAIIIKKYNLDQISDDNSIRDIVREILNTNTDIVTKYLQGKTKLLGFFVGEVMKQTKGKANPKVVNEILIDEINKTSN